MFSKVIQRTGLRRFSTIPINKVSWVNRFQVSGEPQAVKVREAVTALKSGPLAGAEVDLQICKSAWDVNVSVTFESLEAFKAGQEGAASALKESVQPLADASAVHEQAFTMERL